MKSTPSRSSGTVARTGLFLLAFVGFVTVSGVTLASEWDGWNDAGVVEGLLSNETTPESSNGAWADLSQEGEIAAGIDAASSVSEDAPQQSSSASWTGDAFSSDMPDGGFTAGCFDNGQCNDGNACTGDVCLNGSCVNPFSTSPCDDGDSCTVDDQCSMGSCQGGQNVCLGGAPTRSPFPSSRPTLPPRNVCAEGSRMCDFGPLGNMCVENDKCCSNSDCSAIGSYCSFFLTCQCALGEHVCPSTNTCSAGNCCPGDTCAPGQSCDDGNSCTREVCAQQPNGTSTPYYLWESQPIPSCGGCVANVGDPCTSPSNACGQTVQGKIQCDGACDAVVPPITGMHLACALGQCILFPNIPGQCTDVESCTNKRVGDSC